MSESPSLPQPVAPARSGWVRAVVAFTILGGGAFTLGRFATHDDSGTIPSQIVMISVLSPFFALLGFGLWWCLLGNGTRLNRVLSVLGVIAGFGAVSFAAEKYMQFLMVLLGVPLAVGITGLVLAVAPPARRWPVAALVALVAVAPWLALRHDGGVSITLVGRHLYHEAVDRRQKSVH